MYNQNRNPGIEYRTHIDISVYPTACLLFHYNRFRRYQYTHNRKYRRRNVARNDIPSASIRIDKPCGCSLPPVWNSDLALQQW